MDKVGGDHFFLTLVWASSGIPNMCRVAASKYLKFPKDEIKLTDIPMQNWSMAVTVRASVNWQMSS